MARAKPEPGHVFADHRVIERIHSGGMAALWSMENVETGAAALMKVPLLREGEDPALIVGFEMEQMILPRLSGPNVPRFIANGDFTEEPFILMEKVEGETLLPKLKTLPLPPEEVAGIGRAVASALASLHRQRVVHLDIKPSNIIIRPGGEAVLIDFGLSRHLDLPDLVGEEFRLPYGTAPYMAPEQVLGVRHDPRSDFFALGCLMYFFATGQRPFGDPQRLKGLKRRLWWDPVPPRALNPAIPAWLQEIILRCLEVDARRRHPNARQLLFDLAHPAGVQVTARGERLKRDGFFERLKRKGQPHDDLIDRPADPVAGLAGAPIVAVAIDFNSTEAALADALRRTVTRIADQAEGARIACLNVMKQSRIRLDQSMDEDGNSVHVARMVDLKDWARDLRVPLSRLSFHVLEAFDPAEAILDYSRANAVDHIVMGARQNSAMRKLLGSVSGRVAAEAPCTVTVVRERGE
jgi:eukaryotic-like serine/threonine-protein kinase